MKLLNSGNFMWVYSDYFVIKCVNDGATAKFVPHVSLAEGGTGSYYVLFVLDIVLF
jgi:hypothetical protein